MNLDELTTKELVEQAAAISAEALAEFRARGPAPKNSAMQREDIARGDLIESLLAEARTRPDFANVNESRAFESRAALNERIESFKRVEKRDETPEAEAKPVAVTQVNEPEPQVTEVEQREAFAAAHERLHPKAEARYGSPLGNISLTGLPDVRAGRTFEDFGHWVRQEAGFEARAASEGTATAGGHLVPTELSTPILDLAVNAMQVKAAGATVIPMNSWKLDKPVQTSDPTPSWRAEGAAIATSDPVFSKVTFTAKSLAVYTPVSMELLEDSDPDFGAVLAQSLARAFALELDRVALYGSGASNQPLGLKPNIVANASSQVTHFTGANGGTLASATAAPALAGAISRVKGRNYTPTGQLYSSRTEMQLGSLLEGTANQPLRMPDYVNQVPTYVTNQIPNNITLGTNGGVGSDYFVGDWSNLMIGLRTDFRIMRNDNALQLSNGQVAFVGWLRADVQVARLGAFEILDGLNG